MAIFQRKKPGSEQSEPEECSVCGTDLGSAQVREMVFTTERGEDGAPRVKWVCSACAEKLRGKSAQN